MRDTDNGHFGYHQIADELRSRIRSGAFGPGSVLPSESALAEEFSVARGTARRAVEALEKDGLVTTVRGRGRFIAGEGVPAIAKHKRVADILRQRLADGKLRPGDSLPSESELCAEFDVSRSTARQAFAELERAGLARAEKGSGRVVTVPPDFDDDGNRSTAWKVFGERSVYENYWATVTLADIQTPDGERFEHHKVYLPPAAMTAMVDDQDRVFMMWRHRFVSDTWNWELPGGVVDDGEAPAETAAREILEETGYRPKGALEHVASFEPMIGTVRSPHHVFVARGVEYVTEPTEKNESQRTAWVPLEIIPKLIASGKIANSGTLVAVLYLLSTRSEKSG
ncbi:GntR family transcriptional regulator [Streptomyces huiliensis]|uniref:GntR family transcriptional regulator n=1 Tax=Streptomyces huiliensis TaxID=2876027 RepID=UPI001CBC3961|nr:GntR family transcriptional regulator [Streptomyces huiliensis]MBZ4319390.1 GntR family transcriptional regulator [Streptomyces huiliensis]